MYNRPSERYAADRTAESLEGQNDEALEGLSAKVKLLKNVRLPLSASSSRRLADAFGIFAQITIGIGNEVRDSTKMLNGMVSRTSPLSSLLWPTRFVSQNDTFGETGSLLGGTMKKMQRMARRQGGQWCMCACENSSPFRCG